MSGARPAWGSGARDAELRCLGAGAARVQRAPFPRLPFIPGVISRAPPPVSLPLLLLSSLHASLPLATPISHDGVSEERLSHTHTPFHGRNKLSTGLVG